MRKTKTPQSCGDAACRYLAKRKGVTFEEAERLLALPLPLVKLEETKPSNVIAFPKKGVRG